MVAPLDLVLLVLEQFERPQRLIEVVLPEHLQKELAIARLVHSQKSAVVALLGHQRKLAVVALLGHSRKSVVVALLGHSRKSVVVALVLLVLEQFLLLVHHLGTHQLQVLLQFLLQSLNEH